MCMEYNEQSVCPHCKHTQRDEDQKKLLQNRLRRIEGQVRGLQKGGSIKIDGVDIRDMKREDLRSLFSLVLQDTWLFSGSIYDNIRYGRLNARKDEVIDELMGTLKKLMK